MPMYKKPKTFEKILNLPKNKRTEFENCLNELSGVNKAAKYLQSIVPFTSHTAAYNYVRDYKLCHLQEEDTLCKDPISVGGLAEDTSALIPTALIDATKKSILEAVEFTERQTSLAAMSLQKMKENARDLEFVKDFVALQELQKIAFIQYERALKFVEAEARILKEDPDHKAVGGVKENLESTFTMFTKIAQLQMDLGILVKQEKPQNHLHISLQPHQEEILRKFNEQQKVNDLTTEALQIIMS